MTFQTWWLYVCAVFLLCATPGPNMLHILTRSVRYGIRRSVVAMAGCLGAVGIAFAASAAGLTALLTAVPGLFDAVRYAGVAYLVYLGVRSWRDDTPIVVTGIDEPERQVSGAALFRGGFLVGISNPKLLVFAAAFLPQFVEPSSAKGPQFALLVATFVAVELFWYSVYALGGRRLARSLAGASWHKAFNRLTGALFVGFGGALLGYRI